MEHTLYLDGELAADVIFSVVHDVVPQLRAREQHLNQVAGRFFEFINQKYAFLRPFSSVFF